MDTRIITPTEDRETGEVVYTGRSGDLARREGEQARDAIKGQFEFVVDKRTNNYGAMRGREQVLFGRYQPRLNKINPISPRNPNYDEYIEAGMRLEE